MHVSRLRDAAIAAAFLIASDVAVRVLPFGFVAKRVRRGLRRTTRDADAAIARVQWAVRAARRRIPWPVSCLAAAVAANRLLARRGVSSEIRFGVRAANATTDAHAWLVAGGRVVTGSGEMPQFTPLHTLATSAP